MSLFSNEILFLCRVFQMVKFTHGMLPEKRRTKLRTVMLTLLHVSKSTLLTSFINSGCEVKEFQKCQFKNTVLAKNTMERRQQRKTQGKTHTVRQIVVLSSSMKLGPCLYSHHYIDVFLFYFFRWSFSCSSWQTWRWWWFWLCQRLLHWCEWLFKLKDRNSYPFVWPKRKVVVALKGTGHLW